MLRSDVMSESGRSPSGSQAPSLRESSAGGSNTFRSRSGPKSHYAQSQTGTSAMRFKSVSAVLPIASPANDIKCCTFGAVANSDEKLRGLATTQGQAGGSRRGSVASAKTAASIMSPAQVASMVADPHYLMGSDVQPFHMVTGGKHGLLEVRNAFSGLTDAAVPELHSHVPTHEIGLKLGTLVVAMCYSPKGHLWCGYADGTIRIYDLTNAPLEEAKPGMSQPLSYIDDDRKGPSGASRLLYEAHRHSGPITAIVHSAVDAAQSMGGGSSPVRASGGVGFAAGTQEKTACGVPPSMFTCGADWKILRWHMNAPFGVAGAVGSHSLSVRSMAVTNTMLISGGDDQVIRLWPFHLLEKKKQLEGHTSSVVTLVYHRSLLWSGAEDGTIRVWNIDGDRQCLHTLIGHQSHVVSIKPVDSLMYTADKEGVILVWELQNFELLHCYKNTSMANPTANATSTSTGAKGITGAGGSSAGSTSSLPPSKLKGRMAQPITPRGGSSSSSALGGSKGQNKQLTTKAGGNNGNNNKKGGMPTASATGSGTFYIQDVRIVANIKGSLAWFLTTDGVRLAFLPTRPIEEELERKFGPDLEVMSAGSSQDLGMSPEDIEDLRLRLQNFEVKEHRQYEALQDLQDERDEYCEFADMVTDEFIEYSFHQFFEHTQRQQKLFISASTDSKGDVMKTNEALQGRINQLEHNIVGLETKLQEKSKLFQSSVAKHAKEAQQQQQESSKLRIDLSKVANELKQSQFELRGAKDSVTSYEIQLGKKGKDGPGGLMSAVKLSEENHKLRQDLTSTKKALESLQSEVESQTSTGVSRSADLAKKATDAHEGEMAEANKKIAQLQSSLEALEGLCKKHNIDTVATVGPAASDRSDSTATATTVGTAAGTAATGQGPRSEASSAPPAAGVEVSANLASVAPILTPIELAKGDETVAKSLVQWIEEQQQMDVNQGTPVPNFSATDALLALYQECVMVQEMTKASGEQALGARDQQIIDLKKKSEAERARIGQLQNAVQVLKERVSKAGLTGSLMGGRGNTEPDLDFQTTLDEEKAQRKAELDEAVAIARKTERQLVNQDLLDKDNLIIALKSKLESVETELANMQRLREHERLQRGFTSGVEGIMDEKGLGLDPISELYHLSERETQSSIQALSRELDQADRVQDQDQKARAARLLENKRRAALAGDSYQRAVVDQQEKETLQSLLSQGGAGALRDSEAADAMRMLREIQGNGGGGYHSPHHIGNLPAVEMPNSPPRGLNPQQPRQAGDIGQDELATLIGYLGAVKRKLVILEKAVVHSPTQTLRDGALVEIYRLHQSLQQHIEEKGFTEALGGRINLEAQISAMGIRSPPQQEHALAFTRLDATSREATPPPAPAAPATRKSKSPPRKKVVQADTWVPRRNVTTKKSDPNSFVKRSPSGRGVSSQRKEVYDVGRELRKQDNVAQNLATSPEADASHEWFGAEGQVRRRNAAAAGFGTSKTFEKKLSESRSRGVVGSGVPQSTVFHDAKNRLNSVEQGRSGNSPPEGTSLRPPPLSPNQYPTFPDDDDMLHVEEVNEAGSKHFNMNSRSPSPV